MTCRACDRPHPGPVPADSLAALNAPRRRSFVLRVLRGVTLYVRPTTDHLCRKCENDLSRAPIVVPMRRSAC